jgi:Flp pilus assembly protein TadG
MSMKNIVKPLKSTKGQSLVEMALVLPIFMIIVFGIVDFGMIFNAYQIVGNASREGARSMAVGQNEATVNTIVKDKLSSLPADSTPEITIEELNGGYDAKVTVTYNYDSNTPLGFDLGITRSTTMRVEKPIP